jgi:hypothetical protein
MDRFVVAVQWLHVLLGILWFGNALVLDVIVIPRSTACRSWRGGRFHHRWTGISTFQAEVLPRQAALLILAATAGFFFVFFVAEFHPAPSGRSGLPSSASCWPSVSPGSAWHYGFEPRASRVTWQRLRSFASQG